MREFVVRLLTIVRSVRAWIEEQSPSSHQRQEIKRSQVSATISFDEETIRAARAEAEGQQRTQNSIKNATWGAFIAASVYALISLVIMGAILQGNRISHDTLIRSQRPWLADDGSMTYQVTPPNNGQDSASTSFTFQAKNFGLSPGLQVGEGVQPFIRTSGDMHDFDVAREQACQLGDTMVAVAPQTIFPQQLVTYRGGGFISKFGKAGAVAFYGCIAYRDQFETGHTTHHTTFCVFGPVSEPHSLGLCGAKDIAN